MEITYPYFLQVPVTEQSQTGSARRESARMAALEGMPEVDVGRVSIVTTEAANNVLKHGKGGEMLFRAMNSGAATVDIIALDKGPGIHNLAECMRDGYSSSGTPGTGLGAMERMSDVFELFSSPGAGAAVHCRVTSGKNPETIAKAMESGVVIVPIKGETRCGDGWAEYHTVSHSVYMVADGLGHGAGAAEAAEEAVRAFNRMASVNPLDILDEVHHVLRKTRGAAVSVASIDLDNRKVRFAGVGNVSAAIMTSAKLHNMVSHNGIVGHTVGRLQDFIYDWPAQAILAMFSDGIGSHWNLSKYPGLQSRSPLMIASVIYRDFSRRRDDATVLIAREKAART
jgi:anti-sigma regulatory factor (Ser/Thr protein kinase)